MTAQPNLNPLHLRCHHTLGSLHLDVEFTLTQPWTVLFGPSGSGKSTILRILAGLLQPGETAVAIGNQDLTRTPAHKRGIALVAQEPSLFPHRTVRQNVFYATPSVKARKQGDAVLAHFHLLHVANRKPADISGGEQQRAAIARAVQSSPHTLLLDEVFTGLQSTLRNELMGTLRTLQSNTSPLRILSVTHDVAEALQADEALTLCDGRITAQGLPATVLAAERSALETQLKTSLRPQIL